MFFLKSTNSFKLLLVALILVSQSVVMAEVTTQSDNTLEFGNRAEEYFARGDKECLNILHTFRNSLLSNIGRSINKFKKKQLCLKDSQRDSCRHALTLQKTKAYQRRLRQFRTAIAKQWIKEHPYSDSVAQCLVGDSSLLTDHSRVLRVKKTPTCVGIKNTFSAELADLEYKYKVKPTKLPGVSATTIKFIKRFEETAVSYTMDQDLRSRRGLSPGELSERLSKNMGEIVKKTEEAEQKINSLAPSQLYSLYALEKYDEFAKKHRKSLLAINCKKKSGFFRDCYSWKGNRLSCNARTNSLIGDLAPVYNYFKFEKQIRELEGMKFSDNLNSKEFVRKVVNLKTSLAAAGIEAVSGPVSQVGKFSGSVVAKMMRQNVRPGNINLDQKSNAYRKISNKLQSHLGKTPNSKIVQFIYRLQKGEGPSQGELIKLGLSPRSLIISDPYLQKIQKLGDTQLTYPQIKKIYQKNVIDGTRPYEELSKLGFNSKQINSILKSKYPLTWKRMQGHWNLRYKDEPSQRQVQDFFTQIGVIDDHNASGTPSLAFTIGEKSISGKLAKGARRARIKDIRSSTNGLRVTVSTAQNKDHTISIVGGNRATREIIANSLARLPESHIHLLEKVRVFPSLKLAPNIGGRVNPLSKHKMTLYSDDVSPDLIAHEFGHIISPSLIALGRESRNHKKAWKKAIRSDGNNPSTYGASHLEEDFSETLVFYLETDSKARNNYRKKFPNRFKYLDNLFRKKVVPKHQVHQRHGVPLLLFGSTLIIIDSLSAQKGQ